MANKRATGAGDREEKKSPKWGTHVSAGDKRRMGRIDAGGNLAMAKHLHSTTVASEWVPFSVSWPTHHLAGNRDCGVDRLRFVIIPDLLGHEKQGQDIIFWRQVGIGQMSPFMA